MAEAEQLSTDFSTERGNIESRLEMTFLFERDRTTPTRGTRAFRAHPTTPRIA